MRHWSFEPLEPRRVLDSTVVFNEVMYNPPGPTDDALEWIELSNQMAVDMDLSGWRLDGGIEFEFPSGTVLGGGQRLVVAADPDQLTAAGFAGALGPFSGRLSNGGEELRLLSNTDRLMNRLDFGDSGRWPATFCPT